MTSAKFSDFSTPVPLARIWNCYPIKFTQSTLVDPLFHDPPPPSNADITSGGSLMDLMPFSPWCRAHCVARSWVRTTTASGQ